MVLPRRLLLLDEPFDGLDGEVRARVQALMEDAVRGGTQVVLATHHSEDGPSYIGRFMELRAGRRPRFSGRP